jgi:septum formation protein
MLVLASRSPQRKAILEQLGIEFEVRPSDAEELTEGPPRDVVVENALRKARACTEGPDPPVQDRALRGLTPQCILGADTEVVLDGRIYGKAGSEEEAEAYLRSLSGRTHEVWGGIALIDSDGERTAHSVTKVTFRDIEPDIDWYLATGEWRDRAGAYAIQGRGSALVERIEGDFWNVVGLSVPELVRLAPHLIRG